MDSDHERNAHLALRRLRERERREQRAAYGGLIALVGLVLATGVAIVAILDSL